MLSKVPELSDIHKNVNVRCILDGELAVIKDGKPDFFEIQKRSMMSNPIKIDMAAKKYPACFTAFDILYYEDKQVTDLPLFERKELLQKAVKSENSLFAVSRYIEENGTAFYQLAEKQELEGIVAKKKESHYYFDKRTKDWIKIKNLQDDDFVVLDYVPKENNMNSIILGQYSNNNLIYKGHVTLGVGGEPFRKIKDLEKTNCPFSEVPKGNENAVWVKPELVCNVSGRVTNYLTNSDGQDIIEETGSGVYHKYYETENEKVETIDDSTKTTYINENDDSTVITYNTSYTGSGATTHEKNTDKFGRTTNEKVVIQDKAGASSNVYNKEYSYMTIYNGNTTDKVSKITYTGTYNKTLRYGYDGCGNISEINDMWYLYDEAGQLTTEVNINTNTGKDYVYDKGGNITEVRHFENGEYGATDTYTYGNSNWKDLLTEYNGREITYDEIGNPIKYYNGLVFSWTMGRRLETARNGGGNMRYTYNADGLRTSKAVNRVKYNYYWNGDKLTGQTWQGNTLYFYYDKDGNPIGFDFNDNHYYYVTNLQGDIIAILSTDGELVGEYEYDAWGNCTTIIDKDGIAYINPLRYRGYYYDTDTGLYYLQGRYYDSNIGRFINADESIMLLNNVYNLYAYCENNPINHLDPNGKSLEAIGFAIGAFAVYMVVICYSSIVSSSSWSSFCTSVGNGMSSAWGTLKGGVSRLKKWSVKKLKALLAALNAYLTVVRAESKIRNNVKRNSRTRYWSATLGKNCVDLGRKLSYSQAVAEVKKNKSVFTVTKAEAYAVAKAAGGGKTPMYNNKHKNSIGYYNHYHVYNHSNGAHVWFLF